MKGTVAAVAAMAGVASAAHHNHRRAHELFARGTGAAVDECLPGCTTIWETYYGEATVIQPAPEPTPTSADAVVPTPEVEDCPTPGTYSWDATTITLTESTTVCAATTTKLGPGTHTYGGVTTIVETATTVTCPIATETTDADGVVTSTIVETTFVCPTPGTYTIAPTESVVTVDETIIVYPIPTSYEPGTYTKPAATVTVTETGYVTVCPWEGGPSPAPEAPKEEPEQPKEEPKEEPEQPKEEPKEEPQSPPSGGLGGNGKDHWAITYTPYTEDEGLCKSRDEVFADIKRIKGLGFDTVRTYSTDCDTLENVGDAIEKEGMKMMVGVFVKEAGCGYSGVHKQQTEALVAWGKWHLVSLCVIGNEAIFAGLCNVNQLKGLIDTAKGVIKNAGYTGPFTTAETVDIWENHGSVLCDSVDISGANTHPYFNPNTAAQDAGPFVRSQLDIVAKVCGKRAISLECGWPQEGKCIGKACPSPENQATAISSIRKSCGEDVVFFTYGQAHWKGDSDCGCEPYFNVEGVF